MYQAFQNPEWMAGGYAPGQLYTLPTHPGRCAEGCRCCQTCMLSRCDLGVVCSITSWQRMQSIAS